MAQRGNPYHVVTLKYYDFKYFKSVESKTQRASKTEGGKKPGWKQMKWMRFQKNDPEICHLKFNPEEADEFQRVKVSGVKHSNEQMQPVFKEKLAISSAKKKY